jgi:uncharacterized protein YlxW (UPF0749 family)
MSLPDKINALHDKIDKLHKSKSIDTKLIKKELAILKKCSGIVDDVEFIKIHANA